MDHFKQNARAFLAPGPLGPAADILHRLLQGRFSCRGFLPQPVPQATIETMLGLA